MKHAAILLTVTVVMLGLTAGCRNPNNSNNNDDSDPPEFGVCVGGYYNDGSKDIAAYWKDDASGVNDLYSINTAQINDIFIDGTTVYSAGQYTNSSGNQSAAYWKDGTIISLYSDTTGSVTAAALGIWIDGSDVYVAGYVDEGVIKKACYWKNDSSGIQILNDTDEAEARDITVYENTIYTAGYYDSDSSSNLDYRAVYWQDTTVFEVSAEYSQASGIYIDGGTVYTAGYVLNSGAKAAYWQGTSLQDNQLSTDRSEALHIAGDGTDVYVCGSYEHEPGERAACYWTVGTADPVDLYKQSGITAEATGIVAKEGSIYVSGYRDDTAVYWKDGGETDLATGSSSQASAIDAE